MAKSLKSKSKRHFRAVKRTDPTSAFSIANNARLARLSNKLKESAAKPKALTDAEEYRRKEAGIESGDDEEVTEGGEGMTVDGSAEASTSAHVHGEDCNHGDEETEASSTKKVSTSGPRLSRRESYRTDKGFQVRLAPKTHFRARGEGKRMGCKPHRRR